MLTKKGKIRTNRTEIYKKGSNKENKKGFTILELMIVMAVLAILVLLASPRYLNHINDAYEALIMSDSRIMKGGTKYDLARNQGELSDFILEKPLTEFDNTQRVYDKTGRTELEEGEQYYIVSSTDLKIRSTLDVPNSSGELPGQFITDVEGNVFYIQNGDTEATPTEPEDEP